MRLQNGFVSRADSKTPNVRAHPRPANVRTKSAPSAMPDVGYSLYLATSSKPTEIPWPPQVLNTMYVATEQVGHLVTIWIFITRLENFSRRVVDDA